MPPQYPNKTPRAVFATGNRTFEELERKPVRAWLNRTASGLRFGDFDNDGDVDILIVNLNEPPSLLRNDLKTKQELDQGEVGGVKSTAALSAPACL